MLQTKQVIRQNHHVVASYKHSVTQTNIVMMFFFLEYCIAYLDQIDIFFINLLCIDVKFYLRYGTAIKTGRLFFPASLFKIILTLPALETVFYGIPTDTGLGYTRFFVNR